MNKLNDKKRKLYIKQVIELLEKRRRRMFRDMFLELHPTDQVQVFHALDNLLRKQVILFLNPEEFAEIFQGLDPEDQGTAYEELGRPYMIAMFNHMSADDVADFLAQLNRAEAQSILDSMDQEESERVHELMAYAPKTAGAIMTKEFVSLEASALAKDVIEELRKTAPEAETIYYLYVVDVDQKLVGVISLRDLIIASPQAMIQEIMSTQVVSVSELEDQKETAELIKNYDFLAVPVVTNEGRLVGIVTVDDVIDVLEEETTEDFGEFTASRGATDLTLNAVTAAKKRAPWIIILMFFGLATAELIGRFEDTLQQIVLLAAFMPLIMGTAGNTGTQSLAVAVRGLAVGAIEKNGVWKIIKREFGTGLLLGLVCMVVLMGIIGLFYQGNWLLALIVGISIFCALSMAAVIGATVPLVINKLKFDPAIASGPFITTLNDILGLLIYFSIATLLLGSL